MFSPFSNVEEGDPVVMNPGEVLMQRGTLHSWANKSNDWARMHFVLIGKFRLSLFYTSNELTYGRRSC